MGTHFIYFYGTEDGSEVKIGRTKQDPMLRRGQHEHDAGRGTPMRTLAVVLGNPSSESALKRHFKASRSRPKSSEWLHGSEEVRSYLRWLRAQPFVATSDSDLESLRQVDPSEWLPSSSRRKGFVQLSITDPADAWADLEVDQVMEGDFYSPPSFVEPARAAMGSIDLDPASCREANSVVQAALYYGFRENGLLQEWGGNVWLNPPYGNWQEWVPKLLSEWNSGRVLQMCVLVTTRVSTAQAFHPLVKSADAVFIARGRHRFWGPHAKEPDEGHLIFYLGTNTDAFRREFSDIGSVFVTPPSVAMEAA